MEDRNETRGRSFPVSWEELHRNAKALAWRLIDLRAWAGIVAVTRGGLVPAAIVARELNIQVVETACIASYAPDGDRPEFVDAPKILKPPASTLGDGTDWLVIDDLADSGRTFEILKRLIPKAHYATVYAKPLGRPLVDTYMTEVGQDTWIYFPWDVELQFSQPIAALKKDQ